MTIGEKIRRLREERGWSQRELANKAGIKSNIISRYELDQINPTIGVVKKFSIAFGVSIDSIAFDELYKDAINDRELYELFKRADKLDVAQRKLIKDVTLLTVEKYEK